MAIPKILEQPTRFASKEDAELASASIPLAGAVFISPVTAKIEGVKWGWYVGFPSSVSARLISFEVRALAGDG